MTSDEHEQLGADLSAYLDGELSQRRATEIEQMLDESPEARAMLEELRAISEQLGGLPRTQSPEDLSRLEFLSAQRADASEQRSRVKRARVYRLVTRVSASAALIALCVFAGWNYFGRDLRQGGGAASDRLAEKQVDAGERFAVGIAPESANPPTRDGELDETAVRSAPAAAPAVAMGRLRSPGYTGGNSGPRASMDTEAAPASPPPGLAGAILADADESDAAITAVATPQSPVITDQPEINVVVTPRNADEYDGALLAVAQWRTPDGEVEEDGADAPRSGVWTMPQSARGDGGRFATIDAMMAQEITINVPPDQVNSVLVALNEQAPRQVQATMSFNTTDMSVVQRMVTPAEGQRIAGATPAEAADEIEDEETPPSDSASALEIEAATTAGATPGYAGGGGVRRGVATRAPARGRLNSADESKRKDVGEDNASLEKRSAVARDKLAAKSEPDDESRMAAKEPQSGVVQLGVRLRETYEQVFAAVFRGEGDARLAEKPAAPGRSLGEQPVRLRVQLLPPMDQKPATQPAKSDGDETP